MNIRVIDTKGNTKGRMDLPDEMFAVKANGALLAQAVRVYLANQRQGTAKVKSRGEVEGSGRKIYRQKGTGRARHGDRYAPIFVGGGVAHGPRGDQNVKRTMSKKMRKKALFAALSGKLKEKKLIVVDGLESLEPKTKLVNKAIKTMIKEESVNVAVILPRMSETVVRGARNIANLTLLSARKLNAYEILKSDTILLTKDAMGVMEETFLGKTRKPQTQKRAVQQRKASPRKGGLPKKEVVNKSTGKRK